jgi:hypothetical protein
MILLANLVGSAPYFTLPVEADDAYAAQIAAMVRDELRRDVDVYVELGNENWHTGFHGGIFAETQGALTTPKLGRFCWTARRTRQLSQIWRGIFPVGQHLRLKFVLSSQYSNVDATGQLLACADTAAVDADTA